MGRILSGGARTHRVRMGSSRIVFPETDPTGHAFDVLEQADVVRERPFQVPGVPAANMHEVVVEEQVDGLEHPLDPLSPLFVANPLALRVADQILVRLVLRQRVVCKLEVGTR